MNLDQKVRDQWLRDFIIDGALTKLQAEIVVRALCGEDLGRIAQKVGVDRVTARAKFHNAMDLSQRHRPTHLLLLGPRDFYDNPDNYPELRDRAYELADREIPDNAAKVKLTVKPNLR